MVLKFMIYLKKTGHTLGFLKKQGFNIFELLKNLLRITTGEPLTDFTLILEYPKEEALSDAY